MIFINLYVYIISFQNHVKFDKNILFKQINKKKLVNVFLYNYQEKFTNSISNIYYDFTNFYIFISNITIFIVIYSFKFYKVIVFIIIK